MDETQDIDVEIEETAEQSQLHDLEQEEDAQDADEQEEQDQERTRADSAATGRVKGPTRERKEQPPFVREPGKSLFPHTRVQKIIKADKVCFIRL
jgi:hypothetical protein